ncbi:2-aminoethylphosphonate--pyruvate transaminase-like [Antedon mediterranea]|uniref:2-aminoethylphosphonate--pyruvate transaminase-like n=1 Tax=Antedon mediterranea TaxID=105859 RepID=UPI003AF5EFFC
MYSCFSRISTTNGLRIPLVRSVIFENRGCSSTTHLKTNEKKKLFTPGPLGISQSTKEAMLRDVGSRDVEFIDTVAEIRGSLLEIAGVSCNDFTCTLLPGSGTYAVESVLSSTTPKTNGKVLILENGAYGKRMGLIAAAHGLDCHVAHFSEDKRIDVEMVEKIMAAGSTDWTNVSVVHCETSSGALNPVQHIGHLVKMYAPNCTFFVDAMSSFGAVPLDIEASNIDFVVSSANKCVQGVPGFSYIISKKTSLQKCEGWARSLSFDLLSQDKQLNNSGQFRFTPPTHAILAFKQALKELKLEGGVENRGKRYAKNNDIISKGMQARGFDELLRPQDKSYIISSFYYPQHPNFNFQEFYTRLNDKGQVIYPGKLTERDCFRIGNIGHLFPEDMDHLLQCIEVVCKEMEIPLPLVPSGKYQSSG